MKRKTRCRFIAAGLYVILLSVLLTVAVAIAYQRVILGKTSSFDRSIIRDVMGKAELYDRLRKAVRAPDCGLSPLANVMGLMGIVSFTLIAVNEVQSKRSFGILMEEVVNYYFPFHLYIQVFFYICFAVLGGYACGKGIGMTGALCVLGLLNCFIYSVIMAWKLLLSPKAKYKLVIKYINGIMKRQQQLDKKLEEIIQETKQKESQSDNNDAKLGENQNNKNWRQRRKEKRKNRAEMQWQQQWEITERTVLDFARYVGMQWQEKMSLQIYDFKGIAIEQELIDWMKICLTLPQNSTDQQEKIGVGNSFQSFFATDKDLVDVDSIAEYVLYTKCLPFTKDKDRDKEIVDFNQNIQWCCKLWESLFHGIQDEKARVRLTHKLLRNVYFATGVEDQALFTLLSLGLLEYQGFTQWTVVEAKEYQEKRFAFLIDLLQADAEADPEEKGGFLDGWVEIVLLATGCLKWRALLSLSYAERSNNIKPATQRMIRSLMLKPFQERIATELDKYIVFAWISLFSGNKSLYEGLTVRELRECMKEIRGQVRREMYNN